MRLLLDTHLLIWCLDSPQRLDMTTRAAIEDNGNEVLFSAASIWEIAIKTALGRADFKVRPEAIAHEARDVGLTELPVTADVAARVADLPLHHGDPFDKLLVAQAMAGPVWLYTADPVLSVYSNLVRVVR